MVWSFSYSLQFEQSKERHIQKNKRVRVAGFQLKGGGRGDEFRLNRDLGTTLWNRKSSYLFTEHPSFVGQTISLIFTSLEGKYFFQI